MIAWQNRVRQQEGMMTISRRRPLQRSLPCRATRYWPWPQTGSTRSDTAKTSVRPVSSNTLHAAALPREHEVPTVLTEPLHRRQQSAQAGRVDESPQQ
jgi:hypothetical protein